MLATLRERGEGGEATFGFSSANSVTENLCVDSIYLFLKSKLILSSVMIQEGWPFIHLFIPKNEFKKSIFDKNNFDDAAWGEGLWGPVDSLTCSLSTKREQVKNRLENTQKSTKKQQNWAPQIP